MALLDAPAALLVLADGSVFRGWSFGATGTVMGEVVFNTGMTGYQEVMTDPSYCGQIVTFTYPELGNTGVNPDDEESDRPYIRGAVARNICEIPSNWRSTQSLPDYLKQHNIPGIYGIDTRALTRKLRTVGAMNGAISTENFRCRRTGASAAGYPAMAGLNLVDQVTTSKVYEWTEGTSPVWEYRSDRPAPGEDELLTVVAIEFWGQT